MASTVQTERLGVAAVEKILAAAGWFFREQPSPDEGIDAQVEGADSNGRPNGRLLGLQIKSGTSHFRHETDGGWRYPIKPGNLAYWRSYSLPVVIVLYDPSKDRAYWQVVRDEHLTPAGRGHRIFVPLDQELGAGSLTQLEAIANEGLPAGGEDLEDALQTRRARLDIGWIELLASGKRLFLEADEWLHKSSGRGSLRLVVTDQHGDERTEHDWPWVFLPGASYADRLPELFPWADLSIDEDLYRDETYAAFVDEYGVWDSEDKQYVVYGDFDEWFEDEYLGELRPYGESGGGEVAHWRLEFTLNELGERMLREEEAALYEDALLSTDYEERAAAEYAAGSYVGEYGEVPIAQPIERLVFATPDGSDVLVADTVLWADEAARPKLATHILEHALGRAPTDAVIAAFLARFKDVLDDDGREWSIPSSELQDWLAALRT